MRRPTVKGLLAATAVGAVVVVAAAQEIDNRASFWPKTVGEPVVKEWYSDIPWHQKLGTYAGNQIDVPLVFPYDALGVSETTWCKNQGLNKRADCMLEIGVTNILGMLRTDTLYAPDDTRIRAAKECEDQTLPCIEVKLELSNFWTSSENGMRKLGPRLFGTEPPTKPLFGTNVYGGYVVTDGQTYASQMPWYMAHYCDLSFSATANDVLDPVCYGDYLSTMNSGFNAIGKGATDWPRSVAWSVFPSTGAANHCKSGETKCTMVMAGFDLRKVPSNSIDLQYKKYNDNLRAWFNIALNNFRTNASTAEIERHFPWSGKDVSWETFLYPQAANNPFLGQFAYTETAPAVPTGCDVLVTGPNNEKCTQTAIVRASTFLYPRQCTLADLASENVAKLSQCGLSYEIHHNGWLEQWPESYQSALVSATINEANQYGRTSFVFAGVPGMQMPVSFLKEDPASVTLSIYERVHNASIFSLYLPIANVADDKQAFSTRKYSSDFYHTLLMSNHMEANPAQFAEGIRGKTLWHNEYRTRGMYDAAIKRLSDKFPMEMFAAAFDAANAPAPFHNNTCDGCHVRNGSGVPIKPDGKLDKALQKFMTAGVYNPAVEPDYTFTGQIRPMKLVFFDLRRDTTRLDSSRFSEPLAFAPIMRANAPRTAQPDDLYYSNKIMNFYGDSFHATTPGYSYDWTYEQADPNRMVVSIPRFNKELNETYLPQQVKLNSFRTNPSCLLVTPSPTTKPWPSSCTDVDNAAILAAIDQRDVGFLFLNGKRLGNLSVTEAIPNQSIVDFQAAQAQPTSLGPFAGEIIWNAGSRDGVCPDSDAKCKEQGSNSKVQLNCRTKSLVDCFIARFGYIGDRVSLEDQVANAAFVEMNLTTSKGYEKLYPTHKAVFPIRYMQPNCGPANKTCVDSKGNGDLSELDIDRMAEYGRWLGNPTRSELKVALPEVIAGEKIFQRVNCDTCHVIKKINIVPEDTMLNKAARDRLQTRVAQSASPFLSYIGTDLLMHDMGYLSQLADAKQPIRDKDDMVLPAFRNYMQKVRTPALKGLGFNRFVTDSYKNTAKAGDPACDFLLHDGRACDAIEAAFLHDGPAVKKLKVIEGLNGLSAKEFIELRAFLYSL